MKKILSSILVCVLLVGCMFSLAGCVVKLGSSALISGTYEADAAIAKYSFEFSPFGKVTVNVDPILGNSSTHEGKYKVNADTKEITLTFEGDAPLGFDNGTVDFSYGDDEGVDYVEVGILRLKKVD